MRMEFIPAGVIVGVHGVRGEVRVQPGEAELSLLARLPALYLDGKRIPAAVRAHKGMALAKLECVENRDDAAALRGKPLSFRRDDAALPPDAYFRCELPGMEVFNAETGERLGVLEQVEQYPASDVYTVQGEKTYLVPAVPGAFIQSVDLDANRMYIRVWEGLAVDEA